MENNRKNRKKIFNGHWSRGFVKILNNFLHAYFFKSKCAIKWSFLIFYIHNSFLFCACTVRKKNKNFTKLSFDIAIFCFKCILPASRLCATYTDFLFATSKIERDSMRNKISHQLSSVLIGHSLIKQTFLYIDWVECEMRSLSRLFFSLTRFNPQLHIDRYIFEASNL